MNDLTSVLTGAETLRDKINQKVTSALTGVFPLDLKGRTLELKDIAVHERDYSSDEQKRAILGGTSLENPVKGTLVLKGADGRVIDEAKNFTLVHLPYMTNRHTIIAGGNEYQFANQLRRKPGVYTQRADNGELRTVFNLGKGKNFDLALNEKKGTFHLQYGTSNIPMYSVLRGIGVPHDEIAKHLGEGVAKANEKEHGKQIESAVGKLYQKLEHPALYDAKLPHMAKVDAVQKRYGMTTLDPEVTSHTLGKAYDKVTSAVLLDAAKKLLAVHAGKVAVDDTDSLAFKTFHSADDFLAERLRLAARVWSPKAKMALSGKSSIRDALRPAPFSDSIRKFVTTSSLTAVPSGINPLELMDHAVKVTALGEGGIPSDRAIPLDARMTHSTHFGALDPIRTPECFAVGHEAFTAQGWKPFSNLTLTDLIACNINGRLEFHPPSRLIAEPYKGPLYGVKNGKLSYLVTPNHRVYCAPLDRLYPPRGDQSQELSIYRADEAHGRPRAFDTAHEPYLGTGVETFQIAHVLDYPRNVGPIKMTDWASFMGWYISEGNISKRRNKRDIDTPARTHISQSKAANPLKCAMIEALLSRLPFKWGRNETAYTICHKQLATYLSGFGFCDEKWIPEYFFTASIEARRNLLETLLLGGGRINSSRATGKKYVQRVYCTTSRRLAADVERLALSLGLPVRARVYADKREERYLDVYEVRLLQDRYRQASPAKGHYFVEQYDGMVYCATVPGGLLYVRRGDSVGHWTGNSNHAGVDIRATIAAHRDDRGNLYTSVMDVKAGKQAFLKAGDLLNHVVAFPHQDLKGSVKAFVNGEVQNVPGSRVTHQMEHVSHQYSPATSLIPMIHNIQGNRAIMGSKMGTQALPLLEREVPFVQVQSHVGPDVSFESIYGHMTVPTSPVHGTVEKIEGGYVWIRPHGEKKAEDEKAAADDKGLIKVPYETNFPFPSKTYLHHDIQVKAGQTVQAGQRLGDSNFTRNGTLALGKNLLVGYMPYHGMNSNDAVVISDGCARKLTSEHMYREVYPLSSQIELARDKHKTYYGNKFTAQQYAKLDSDGVIKPGARVDPKDPLILGLTKGEIQGVDLMLGRISKTLTKPYREVTLQWEHGSPGEVVEVFRNAAQISILVKTQERMNVGDKLAGRYGNKGVVAKIVPDHEMIKDERGRPLDLILTSAGVVSRINPAQIIETALGKVVEKTGKPILYNNAEEKDAVQWAKNLLKEHGIKDKEHVYDPISKRTIKGPDGNGVLVGRQFIYKLFKSTDTNFSGHGVGPYDVNEQPLKTGGDESAKGIGKMELDALIAHNARNILQEAATVKSQKSDEFWKAIQLGAPLPTPKPTFAFNKFTAMLEGSGIRVDKRGSKFKLLPATDKGVLERSRGEIENKKTLIAKNLKPENGGLFDPVKTGGPQGTLYSHISLHEAIPHPVFVEPVRRLLGLSQKDFERHLEEKGGNWFHSELSKVDPAKRLVELREQMNKASGPELDNVVKQIKYLNALQTEKLKPQDAYMMSKVPVIPPVFRPILPEKRDPSQLMVADANKLYGHLMDVNDVLKNTALESDRGKHRNMVFHAVGAVFGTHEVQDEKLKKQEVKGFLQNIAGVGTPKGGFFQRKMMRRTQDVSGRGTAVPDGNLGMDEVGIPEQMLWQMLDKLIVARLVRQGYGALTARELVDKKAPVAREAMLAESRERPVLINRAPTLHRWSIVAAYPKPVSGKTIRVNPFIEKGMNLDYDGDTLQVHAPIQHGAVEDAKKMTLSQMLLSDQQRNKLMAFPQHEAIIGFTLASKAGGGEGVAKHFRNREEALAAWRSGKLQLSDAIVIDTEKKAAEYSAEAPDEICDLSTEEALSYWPAEYVVAP